MNSKNATHEIVNTIIDLLTKIPDQEFKKPLPLFNGSTLGQHFRHILNFYQSVLNGIGEKVIDYAARERNPIIEQETDLAILFFEQIKNQVSSIKETDAVNIYVDYYTDQEGQRAVVHSSIGRELLYAYDHAIHHLAIIKIGLKTYFPSIEVDENLGVAPSTLKKQQTFTTQTSS